MALKPVQSKIIKQLEEMLALARKGDIESFSAVYVSDNEPCYFQHVKSKHLFDMVSGLEVVKAEIINVLIGWGDDSDNT